MMKTIQKTAHVAFSAAILGATLVTTSSAVSAATLTGQLTINGSVIVDSPTNASSFSFVDSNGAAGTNFNVGFSSLGFDGTVGKIDGTGIIKNLALNAAGELSAAVPSFISGLTLNGQALSFDLFSFTRGTPIVNTFSVAGQNFTSYFYNSSLFGAFKVGSTYLGAGSLTTTLTLLTSTLDQPNTQYVGAYGAVLVPVPAIPTPALLPGLLSLGAVLLRTRQSEEADA